MLFRTPLPSLIGEGLGVGYNEGREETSSMRLKPRIAPSPFQNSLLKLTAINSWKIMSYALMEITVPKTTPIFSKSPRKLLITRALSFYQRRDRDSNPGTPVKGSTVFETAPFDRSGISPGLGLQK
jgi:hypothetical protein